MTGLPFEPIVIVLIMMAILIVLGLFMDWVGILLLTMPIFVPIVEKLGYDPVWFGILFCMNMQISYLSPPFGPAAFYLKERRPARDLAAGHLPRALALHADADRRRSAWSCSSPRSRSGCRAC